MGGAGDGQHAARIRGRRVKPWLQTQTLKGRVCPENSVIKINHILMQYFFKKSMQKSTMNKMSEFSIKRHQSY